MAAVLRAWQVAPPGTPAARVAEFEAAVADVWILVLEVLMAGGGVAVSAR